MFIVLAEDATQEQRSRLLSHLQEQGLVFQEGEFERRAIFLVSQCSRGQALQLAAMEGVEKLTRRLSRRQFRYYGVPFFPYHFLKETFLVFMTVAVLLMLASLYPAALGERVDPFQPIGVKPPWYLLAVHQLLAFVQSPLLGALLQVVGGFVLLFWPFLDRTRSKRGRALVVLLGAAAFLGGLALTVVATIC